MDNIEIQFNAAIIKRLRGMHFQVDEIGSILFILFCLYEGKTDLLDEFDDYNRERRGLLLYQYLVTRGLLELTNSQDTSLYRLTKEGIELVEDIKGQMSVTSEKLAVVGVETLKDTLSTNDDDVESWIDEWVDIFPRGIKSGGKLIRGDRQSCLRKMKVFMKEYSYTRETIMAATRAYIESKRNDNFLYTRCAVYFIYRMESNRTDKVSDLAAWCDQTAHEGTETRDNSDNQLEIMV